MSQKKIFAIIGSASDNSSNEKIIDFLTDMLKADFELIKFAALKTLPPFDPEASIKNPPEEIISFRKNIGEAAGVLICTPEYVFSVPSGLKNAIEWCVADTVFTSKPVGLITASSHGEKGHEELKLLMRTLSASFSDETTLLIQGVKSKIDKEGNIQDQKTSDDLKMLAASFKNLILTSLADAG